MRKGFVRIVCFAMVATIGLPWGGLSVKAANKTVSEISENKSQEVQRRRANVSWVYRMYQGKRQKRLWSDDLKAWLTDWMAAE